MKFITAAIFAAMVMSGSAAYATPGKGKQNTGSGSIVEGVAEAIKGEKLSREERVIIRTVFEEMLGDNAPDAQRGFSERRPGRGGGLPPGLARHVERTGALPPGLQSRELPPGLYKRLGGGVGEGRELFWLDNDVYLIESATRAVIDVVRNVFSGSD